MGVLALSAAEPTRLALGSLDFVLFSAVFAEEYHTTLLGLGLAFFRTVLRPLDFGWFDVIRLAALITFD